MKKLLLIACMFASSIAVAAPVDDYYKSIESDHGDLKEQLHNLIKGHRFVSYKQARIFLFGDFYLQKHANGEYFVKDVYCESEYDADDFKAQNLAPAPNRIPDNQVLNCEHTWPKSRFGNARDVTKSPEYKWKVADLHHLFPADSLMNAVRGNHEFGEVDTETENLKCRESAMGRSLNAAGKFAKGTFFEPPTSHKGNVARAMFYFSTRYNMTISPTEEMYLRQWHVEDPVDSAEIERNNEIFKIQHNRNPFIDHPEFVEAIKDF